jgi:hypothetical protein
MAVYLVGTCWYIKTRLREHVLNKRLMVTVCRKPWRLTKTASFILMCFNSMPNSGDDDRYPEELNKFMDGLESESWMRYLYLSLSEELWKVGSVLVAGYLDAERFMQWIGFCAAPAMKTRRVEQGRDEKQAEKAAGRSVYRPWNREKK